ncbi:hypothetical protein Gotri_008939 [Gossypium trilobum]|uniref:Cytochrome P450 n=1 Tax=Gossypium trilobum TaxID=34281 RepID=A0A7J9EKW8_9ROSI|nr:hypothetical protein [Gossypium trilobum]
MVHCFKTSLVGRQIVVSTDPDVNHFIFQQEGKLVQSWYMDKFDDIIGKDNVLSSHGFLHKYLRNLILNLFGSESLKTKHVSEIEELTSKHLQLWSCQQPSVELKQAISTTKKQDKDFLDVVLEEMNKAGTILSEQTALDLLFALPFAAFESASSAVVLALQYLQSNPLALAELTQEHETILRERETKDSGITWKEYKSMTFTHMVINETIRLGNIVPTIFRKVVKDIEIKGRLDHFGLYTSSSFEPHEIRGSTYIQSMAMEGSKFFMGFGSGVRLCAGAEFVKLQISSFLHHSVTNYSDERRNGCSIAGTGVSGRFPCSNLEQKIHMNATLPPLCVLIVTERCIHYNRSLSKVVTNSDYSRHKRYTYKLQSVSGPMVKPSGTPQKPGNVAIAVELELLAVAQNEISSVTVVHSTAEPPIEVAHESNISTRIIVL